MRPRILETKTSGKMIKAKESTFPLVDLIVPNLEAWERFGPRNGLVVAGMECGLGLSLCPEIISARLEMRRALPTREAEDQAE